MDLVILDINLGGIDGFEVLKEIEKKYQETKVIMFSMQDRPDFRVRALKLGASGFFDKSSEAKELTKAVTSVFSKGYYAGQKHLKNSCTH